jgi:hypothetical protein
MPQARSDSNLLSGIDYTAQITYCVGANLAGQSEPLSDLHTLVYQFVRSFNLCTTCVTLPKSLHPNSVPSKEDTQHIR